MATTLEISGYVLKKEHVASVSNSKLSGTMVLETINPFNGYYAANPEESVPHTFFLITQKEYKRDVISRIAYKVSQKLGFEVDANRAELSIFNDVYHSIRIYDQTDASKIEMIQKEFQQEGIVFKNSSQIIDGEFQIKVWKVFLLNETEPGKYANLGKSKMFYFTLSESIEYAAFESLVAKVKNNWSGKDFDAALTVFYRKRGVEDVVRIFSNHIDATMMKELPIKFELYLK